jgi:hypothetical protein
MHREDLVRGQELGTATERPIFVPIPLGRIAIAAQLDLDSVRIPHVERHAVAVIGRSMEGRTMVQRPPSRGDEVLEKREQDRVMQKPRTLLCRGFSSLAHRAVQREVMVIATCGHEYEARPPQRNFVPEHISIEGFAPSEVRDLQVDMADSSPRMNVVTHNLISLLRRSRHLSSHPDDQPERDAEREGRVTDDCDA